MMGAAVPGPRPGPVWPPSSGCCIPGHAERSEESRLAVVPGAWSRGAQRSISCYGDEMLRCTPHDKDGRGSGAPTRRRCFAALRMTRVAKHLREIPGGLLAV